ncbi:hypothetical protein [Pseudoalteromonas sp. S3785]|nr:hypothetical protein [Pseudoalteromonas sp. S3785]
MSSSSLCREKFNTKREVRSSYAPYSFSVDAFKSDYVTTEK